MLSSFIIFISFFIVSSVAEIDVDTNSFFIFRQPPFETQKNHIKFRFKTIDASGLIMLAQGATKENFLSIELFRGKIRVAGNYGDGPENTLRPISGFYEMFLGKDLADNQWHTVEFIRNIRENIIFIDRGQGKMEKSIFMKSPPTYNLLSVSAVAFGGYYTFQDMSTEKSHAKKGLKACFSEATFSQYWPEVDSKKINFLDTNPSIETKGVINRICQDPPYSPIFFPSAATHIGFIENYTINSLKVELKFRTVVNEQTLVNYTTSSNGHVIELKIDRKGRVAIAVEFSSAKQIIVTAKEDYHDGQWHQASFEIDNKEAADKSYILKLSVDGKTRLSSLSQSFYFNGYLNVGFGFTGCMRDVKINDDDIKKVRRDLNDPKMFFTYDDTGVVYDSCSLKDYCNPNPCQHGSKCNQTSDNVVCDCHNTLYEGSTCNRPRFNYTCAGVRKSGERRSDVYYIDFDGMGPMEPVPALCDLGKTVETTVTQINNTNYNDKDVTTFSGINNFDIDYAANIIQMRELILNSAYCEQYVKYTCKGTPLFRSPEGPPAASWMGGDDILHYYWGGAKGNRGYCGCGMDGSCYNVGKYCNCDSLDAYKDLFDEGNLTVKSHLPVRQVKFEQVLKDPSIHALLRVGHLRCAGFGSREIVATFRKPYSFLSVDHPDQPYDNIFSGGISFEFKTSVAYNYMTLVHAHGPFSGDYMKVMIWSRTMVRVNMNFGFGDIQQDVDIEKIGRYIDDNEWHEFDLVFNLKELNITLDGVLMIQGLPLQEDPVQFNVDDKAVYVGGSYHDEYGFVGCIRSLYVNGRIHDIRSIAQGQEDYGVYPGCGSACMLLNQPCNYGQCIDHYDSFKCNCSVSPYGGDFCQNESYPKSFTSGQYISYDLKKANITEPIATAIFVVGFKTLEENSALATLEGYNDRHFTLALTNGYLTLFYSLKKKLRNSMNVLTDFETEILQISSRKLNNGEHNLARVIISTDEILLTVPNYDLAVGANMTERFKDEMNKNLGTETDTFGMAATFSVGRIINNGINTRSFTLASFYTGCMSGAKLVLTPLPNITHRFPKSVEIDLFKLIQVKANDPDANPYGTFPSETANCGPSLSIPGDLPTVGPARQYNTDSPGLDKSIDLMPVSIWSRVVIVAVSFIFALIVIGVLFYVCSYTLRINSMYNKVKNEKSSTTPEKFSRFPINQENTLVKSNFESDFL
ncbi:contactin-associated protein like 5-3 isoform X2 [Hydra vulgaris]|uniref:Contactin-associated protein like 5-3 isoform X2 n=1 Tax=Hydra vulgaris TaxID=6087 RepID=A0ABM4CVW7_HYDVU